MGEDTLLNLILRAGLIVKIVLLILLGFSIFSWSIILYKLRFLSRIEKETEEFQKAFRRIKDWDALHQSVKKLTLTPLANLFRSIYPPGSSVESLKDISSEDLRRTLRRVEALEVARLEKYLTFLATTGSTTPFIGLFGTVWGIMNAFRGIGRIGSASLAVVAPGIAEALIATAAGLIAAIPAVIAYNYFLSRTRRNIVVMEDFSQELTEGFLRKYG